MKKTNMLLAAIAWLLIVSLVFMGIWPSVQENILQPYLSGERQETGPNAATGSGQSGNQITEFTPRNVIELGDSFEYYPHMAEGHFLCTVTGVRIVTEADQCLPKEAFFDDTFLRVYPGANEKPKSYRYEEWFTEGGAYDQGARIVLVDLTVTNVDAVAWLSDGTLTGTDGYYHDCDAFLAYSFVGTANMSTAEELPDGRRIVGDWQERLIYYSRAGEYYPEELHDTSGQELFALQIPIGHTVSFTLGYASAGIQNEPSMDPSDMWLTASPGRNVAAQGVGDLDRSIFIDTKLGSEEE